jgi:glycosyltransferase involved in cell wall biosynthesis
MERMTMTPKVSIVTCSHNRPEFLKKAINSLRAQTDSDWEHLIYDDASTDPGVGKVLDWAKRDPRVRVWRGQENLDRPSVLWNFMMDRARGRYLTVLDDDNEKLPTFVEAMSKELDDNPELDVVTCGWRVDRTVGEPHGDYFLNLSTAADRLASNSTCDGGAMLYRRETFERAGYFSEALRTNEDWDWLRRVMFSGKAKNLHVSHATYRDHDLSRMKRAHDLGNDRDVMSVKSRHLSDELSMQVVYPNTGRLTESQRDVCTSIERGLNGISWVKRIEPADPRFIIKRDLTLVVSPFQMSNEEIDLATKGSPRMLSLHMEDPYALQTNLDRVGYMNKKVETWVCTNDAATVPAYRKVVGDRVIVCSSLSADSTLVNEPRGFISRDIDILLCGYAYPSRKRFVTELLPLLAGQRMTLVGNGWESFASEQVTVLPTQPLAETYKLHARARAVVCLQRVHGDCSDGAVEPMTLNRGYMEGYSGARVFLDSTRPFHSLDEGDVVWYHEPGDLAGKLWTYLSMSNIVIHESSADRFAEKCRMIYTYKTRLARILNCVRSPRFLAEIP